MQLTFKIAPRRKFTTTEICDMHRLRARVFHDRLGWDVDVIDGLEIDGYDSIEPCYMMMREPDGTLRGCWRILPTQGPYMLKDSFPQLLHSAKPPSDPRIWELSRFAIATEERTAFGFSEIALQSIREIIRYGYYNGIEHYVTVTTPAIERMLKRSNIVTRRFGSPLMVGAEHAVALYVDISKSYRLLAPTDFFPPLFCHPQHHACAGLSSAKAVC